MQRLNHPLGNAMDALCSFVHRLKSVDVDPCVVLRRNVDPSECLNKATFAANLVSIVFVEQQIAVAFKTSTNGFPFLFCRWWSSTFYSNTGSGSTLREVIVQMHNRGREDIGIEPKHRHKWMTVQELYAAAQRHHAR